MTGSIFGCPPLSYVVLGCGLSVLHARNIIHRDLKPLNILLEQTQRGMNPVLTDFGLARELNPDSVGRSAVGTIRYLPPECQENSKNVRYTKQSDMWSMGAILYECWTGRRAFTVCPTMFYCLGPSRKCKAVVRRVFGPPYSVPDKMSKGVFGPQKLSDKWCWMRASADFT